MSEAATTVTAGDPDGLRPWRLLRRAEGLLYWLVTAPLVAWLPAGVAYRIACWRSDWTMRYWPDKRAVIVRHLRQLLGDEHGPEDLERLARDFFRYRSCDVLDVVRLRGRARSLERLVDIRGREHLEAALAGGRGAILCTAHFSSQPAVFSLLHELGFPLTTVGRWDWKYDAGASRVERIFWDFARARRVLRHRQRPHIEPTPGRVQVAVQAAAALRENEVVVICSDAAPLEAEQHRAIEVPFLGTTAKLLPGVITVAQLTGAPVLMAFAYRAADYRHHVLEISAPVPTQGEAAAAFMGCVTAIDAAIRRNPPNWDFWWDPDVFTRLGLVAADAPAADEPVSPALSQ